MEKALNYIGGREMVLEKARIISRTRSIPKEKLWNSLLPHSKRARAPHPYAWGCMCPSCEQTLYRMMEVSRD